MAYLNYDKMYGSLIAHKFGSICHTDVAQSVGEIEVSMEDLVDLFTLSGHKFGGIAGSGVLVYNKNPVVEAVIIDGRQEKDLRGGTENIVAIASLFAAFPDLLSKMDEIRKICDQ